MTVHTIVYVVLCTLAAAAVYAMGTPVGGSSDEQRDSRETEEDAHHSF